MKKASVILAVCLSISLFIPSGCSNKTSESTWYHERVQETTEESIGLPTSTPKPTSTSTPIPTDTPTPSPAPVIVVEDAINESFEYYGRTFVHRVPMITISNVDTTAVNEKIFNDIESDYSYGLSSEGGEYYGFATDYKYYISDQFVSIVFRASNIEHDYGYTDVYNILIADGTLVSGETFISMIGEDPDDFFEAVRETYANWGAEQSEQYNHLTIVDEMNGRNIERASFDNVKPYIGEGGHLCFVGFVEALGGADWATLRFDAVEKNFIRGW